MAKVIFFASDMAETAQLRRIDSFRSAGHDVATFGMRKSGVAGSHDWPHVDLGGIANERLGQRLWKILRSLWPIFRARSVLASGDLLVARNIDMLVLAWLARLVSGRSVPLVYECLDIHGIFTRQGLVGRIARLVERVMLRRIALLVVSSPGFIDNHFASVQRYAGPWFLLENKLWFPKAPLARPRTRHAPGTPLVIGWVGAIRCAPSLDLLCQTAADCGPSVSILIRGVIHEHALPGFHARIAAQPNIRYGGPYTYPDGLAGVYAACDLVWAQDMWQSGANSDWLLPNRLYEASWFGCPSIAVAGTQTARKIVFDGLGFVIDAPDSAALTGLLRDLTADRINAAAHAILAQPDRAFRLMGHEADEIFARATAAQRHPPKLERGAA